MDEATVLRSSNYCDQSQVTPGSLAELTVHLLARGPKTTVGPGGTPQPPGGNLATQFVARLDVLLPQDLEVAQRGLGPAHRSAREACAAAQGSAEVREGEQASGFRQRLRRHRALAI